MRYQVGGSLTKDAPSYVERQADSTIYETLKRGEFCYILNSRQMGKSSLMVRTRHKLEQDGFKCTTLDLTSIVSETITPQQWYKGLVTELWLGFNLFGEVDIKAWWRSQEDVSLVQRLSRFISDVLLEQFPEERLVIFIDEIDIILSLPFAIDDFFALIRSCYNQRAIDSKYQRITFAIFGVATPSDLIQDKKKSPFNIGVAIKLQGFNCQEAQILAKGLKLKQGSSEAVLKEVLAWTDGQPFLTQKICQLLMNSQELDGHMEYSPITIPPGNEAFWVENVIKTKIIQKWETQDEPEHLRTIHNRIKYDEQEAGRILGIYQRILQGEKIETDNTKEHNELILSGLVERQNGLLQVKNRIYQEIFNLKWVKIQLSLLRPYSQQFEQWVASGQKDQSRLLVGQALKDAQLWLENKKLTSLDYQFLAASTELNRQEIQLKLEAERAKEIEARLIQEQKTARLQRYLLSVVSIALLIISGLGITAFWQYRKAQSSIRKAELSELKAIKKTSESLFASDQRLESLLTAIKAKRQFQKLGKVTKDIQSQVENILRRAVYGAIEFNIFSGHDGLVWQVAFSPDGKILASASDDNTVKLWQSNGTLLKTLEGHTAAVGAVDFSPKGKILASASDDKTVKLWQSDGTLFKTLEGHSAGVWGVKFSPDGKMLASTSMDGTIKLWQSDGSLISTLEGHNATVLSVDFSPDGEMLVSGSEDKTVKLWQIDGTLIATLEGHNATVLSVDFSPDGEILASASDDNTVKIWKRDGTLVKELKHDTAVLSVAFDTSGNIIASGGADNTLKIWTTDGTLLKNLKGHSGAIWDVDFSPDGKILASGSGDNRIKLWRLDNTLIKSLKGHKTVIFGTEFSPNGEMLASASGDTTIKLWRQNGILLKTIEAHSSGVTSIKFSSQDKILASTSLDKNIKLWSTDGTLLKTLRGHFAGVWDADFSPDGKMLASASMDSTVKLWRSDGTLIKTLDDHNASVLAVAFHPDGTMFASASQDNTVKLWRSDGTLLNTLEGHTAGVWGVDFSTDGQTLASASADNTIKLWSIDGTLIKTLESHTAGVWGVNFSPDGKVLASASADNTVIVWSIDGTLIKTLESHTAGVWGVNFSPDGKVLASVGEDNAVIIWNLQRILSLNYLNYACDWLQDYLETNVELSESDRYLCKER